MSYTLIHNAKMQLIADVVENTELKQWSLDLCRITFCYQMQIDVKYYIEKLMQWNVNNNWCKTNISKR